MPANFMNGKGTAVKFQATSSSGVSRVLQFVRQQKKSIIAKKHFGGAMATAAKEFPGKLEPPIPSCPRMTSRIRANPRSDVKC